MDSAHKGRTLCFTDAGEVLQIKCLTWEGNCLSAGKCPVWLRLESNWTQTYWSETHVNFVFTMFFWILFIQVTLYYTPAGDVLEIKCQTWKGKCISVQRCPVWLRLESHVNFVSSIRRTYSLGRLFIKVKLCATPLRERYMRSKVSS